VKVLCVKWGDKYSADYVLKLRNMVQRHLTLEHEFVCITDSPVKGVNCIPFVSDLPGWWSKIELFVPDRFPGQNLYLDLDVIITANINDLVRPGFWMRDDFSYSIRNPKQLSADQKLLLGGDGCCNSSVISWSNDAGRDIWDKFDRKTMTVEHGDQNTISRIMRGRIGFMPDDMVQSYKYGILRGGESPGPIVVFHGDPKPSSLHPSEPLKRHWC
jgi:hypothetical protein